jgi:Protein of unknown function (DUF1566)
LESLDTFKINFMKKLLIVSHFALITMLINAQTTTKSMAKLPDTGQTGDYTTTFGEDVDYTINPPSFTNNGNGTITDNVTGLMWQQTDGGEMTVEGAATYVAALRLNGYSDWRLPTAHEGFSILNHQRNNPAIDVTYFTATAAEYWWTSDKQVGDATKIWCTNAGGGIGNHPKLETVSAGGVKKFHVRAVRNVTASTTVANQFTDNSDGTVKDNLTGLTWQKVPSTSTLTWEQALVYAEGLTLGGQSDWRLPNIKELQSINDERIVNPSVSTTYFSTIGTKNYWSSTTLPNQTTRAWYMSTQFGITTYDLKTSALNVIAVRGSSATTPVELTTFNAKAVNKTSILNWHTSSETNSKSFTIERSPNGADYAAIGEVKGQGTTSTPHDYTFTDEDPSVNINYYRLRQTDFDGKETLSKWLFIVFSKSGISLKATVAQSALDVVVDNAKPTTLRIFNVAGQQVLLAKVQGAQQLDIQALPNGLYIIQTEKGETARFLKE